jgi:hypothetical protein
MIRTVRLAAVCLVLLGAMAIGRAAKTPAGQATDEKTVVGTTVDADWAREPLIKADRREVTYVRQQKQSESEKRSQSMLQPIDPIVPEMQKTISPAGTNIVSRHWHDPNAINSSAANSKRTAKKGKPAADLRDGQAADRSKPNEQTRRCDRNAAFGGLMKSLNLAPVCDS